MHYYQFNIGDYKSHTDHLDPLEDIAFRRMMDWSYLHEKQLPLDIKEVARLIRMRTHDECIAYVLSEFFEATDIGYVNNRIAKEIAKYNEKSEKAKQSAQARWKNKPIESASLDDANALDSQSVGNAKQETGNRKQKTLPNNKLLVNTDLEKKVVDYRKSIKKPLNTTAGVNGVIKNLNLTATAWDVSIDTVFDYMAEKEWQSINKDYTNPFANKQSPQQAGGSSIPRNIKILNPGALL